MTRLEQWILIIVCSLASSCGSTASDHEPSIEFTLLPYTHEGGTLFVEAIEGKVLGAKPGQRIVLYAKSGDWYVQPFIDQPFTEIREDSTWKGTTHLGTDFAALLVEPGYQPVPQLSSLPVAGDGLVAVAITRARPYFWQTWWFRSAIALIIIVAVAAAVRMRLNQIAEQASIRFEERLAERMRIAQELHDTLLQGFVSSSLQLYVAIEQLPEDSPARPKLLHIRSQMEKVISDGRDAVQGLRTPSSEEVYPALELSQIGKDLNDGSIDFRVIVQGKPQPLDPSVWDDLHNISREAITNAFRHSDGTKIEVELEYLPKQFRLLVRDNGRGIEPEILESGRERHWGLSGMRERSEKIGAELKLFSRPGAGTEVDVSVPGHMAFTASDKDGGSN
jgi:signal transduction histidine kinase